MWFFFVSCAFVSEDALQQRLDPDGDGVYLDKDCNSAEASAKEPTQLFFDEDGDGYGDAAISEYYCEVPSSQWVLSSTDCDDSNAGIHPGAMEICDGLDNNCIEGIDEVVANLDTDINGVIQYLDLDGDGFGDPLQGVQACSVLEGYVENSEDCDDSNAAVFLGAIEICDNVDNDCNGEIDDNTEIPMYADFDGDGYVASSEPEYLCAEFLEQGYTQELSFFIDCDDSNAEIHPEATESCDEIDNNCNEQIDEGVQSFLYRDLDGDGFGVGATVAVCGQPEGYASSSGDCDDADDFVNPAAEEVCDYFDNNCNDEIDEGVQVTFFEDDDGDGFGDPLSPFLACPTGQYIFNSGDCNDTDDTVYPGAQELCDGQDNNCDNVMMFEEHDGDGDGWVACTPDVNGWDGPLVHGWTDCNNAASDIYPGAAELDDGLDHNCDGFESIDESCYSTELNGVYFLHCFEATDWSTAQTRCNDHGYQFASIRSEEENILISSHVGLGAWIGYHDVESATGFCTPDKSFEWVDGYNGFFLNQFDIQCAETISFDGYHNWDFEEPNNAAAALECVQVGPQGMWSDQNCNLSKNYTCTQR